ncbi:MAG: porin [Thiogranum sp.]|nr:porin [Thiogranum sp.]
MAPATRLSLGTFALMLTASLGAQAETMPDQDEMWRILQQQQREIEKLKSEQQETSEKAEAVLDVVEQGQYSTSGAASWAERTRIGGYGELHYNNLDTDDGNFKELDFHRFVLFFGHQFSDRLRFFSELELEHALSGDGKNGEVELEQAYIEYDLNPNHRTKAGIYILPVGILNETHEPPTFYGVERNPVENAIIPSTWWAGGVALSGEIAPGWSYDVGVHEGLENSSYVIRSGRQKTSNADAHDLASTARLKWTGVAGVELAGTVQYQENITQGVDNDASAWLVETHAIVQRGPYGLRALYARWDIDGDGASLVGRDEQQGFYIEPSYRVTEKFGVFARYNQWDNQAGNSVETEKKQYDIGFNYWPHPDVVFKADYQKQDNESGDGERDGFNLGVGYQF